MVGRFIDFFGQSAFENGIIITYSTLVLRPEILKAAHDLGPQYPYCRPGGSGHIGAAATVSSCELRAVNALSAEFRRWMPTAPRLIEDYELREKLDVDFVALGGINSKASDAIKATEELSDVGSYFEKAFGSGTLIKKDGYDYGLIRRVNPSQFPTRTWLVCAGLGEWGTSSAAWFLANKWSTHLTDRKMEDGEKLGNRPFDAWIKARIGQDESVELVKVQLLGAR
jgi:hypothetical protein